MVLAALGSASPSPLLNHGLSRRAACSGNTATTRDQWCDFSLTTDYYTTVPDTGVTREYFLELTDVTVSPDGVSRTAMAINGSIPGPTIFADWGDTVVVHLTNSLTTSINGSSLHFHGIRQNFTNQNDGVPSITQCPTAVGETTTYTWRATQYGSTWYHSHFALQAWQGVFGGIIINGPASANYDQDLGMLFLNDWSHQTVDELFEEAETSGPPTLDNGLINGTNVFGSDGSDSQTGSRFSVSFVSGTSYRIRLVNAAVDSHFKFSIDNHTLTVIGTDLVPITPYTTNIVSIGMGQRYDIVVTADQSAVATDFWMRAIPQVACSDNDSTDNIRGIVHYADSTSTPTTTGFSYTDSCADEAMASLVPALSKTVDDETSDVIEAVTVGRTNNVFRWFLNSTTMVVDWANPTLLQLSSDETTTFDTSNAVIELPTADEWVYVVIETTLPIPHPIHLHGFDFFVLAQGTGTFSTSTVTLNTANPPRRDTAMLPASGFVVLAFETDNPGAWLMHCHIGWHTSEGFALQFIVRRDEILGLVDTTVLEDTCSAWSSHVTTESIVQEDSGV
ncbi:multicopper oxidase [Cercophora scortea]|uniref:laccase n=1 Tax=Cercophora scortea TaxID=314031 RepID=A0AAE0M2T2_9PEZI|nr:multicopper oxidase [Cercophora scortea]